MTFVLAPATYPMHHSLATNNHFQTLLTPGVTYSQTPTGTFLVVVVAAMRCAVGLVLC